jgi:hypothetical protein
MPYNRAMLMQTDVLALLKVLIAASWADSRLSQTELNYIKALAQHSPARSTNYFAICCAA